MSLECRDVAAEAARPPDLGPLRRVLLPYRRIAGVPHLPALLSWSLAGRLHMTGTTIALTFLVAGWTGSYAYAGVVSALLVAGTAVAGPLRGRAADRVSATRLLTITAVAYGGGLVLLAVLPASAWYLAAPVALAAGLFLPPVGQVSRSSWSRITEGPSRRATFSAEATLQELLFVVGPMLAAGIVAVASARAATLCCAAFACLGALGFAAALRRAGLDQPAGEANAHGTGRREHPFALLRNQRLARLALMTLLVVTSLSAIDLVMVAWSRERGTPGLAGILAAVWAIGSLSGGLISGGFHGPSRLPVRIGAMAVGVLALTPLLPPVTHGTPPWLVAVLLMVGGTAIAPTLAAVNTRASEIMPAERRGEAFGWIATASTAGGAIAAPVTGWLLDRAGPAAGIVGAALCVLFGLVVSFGIGVARRPVTVGGV